MLAAALSKALPPPAKRVLKLLAGWAYSLRRWLRARLVSGTRPAGAPPRDRARDERGETGRSGMPAFLEASNEHGSYCVPASSRDRPVAQAILRSEVWEADTLELLCAADPDGDIVHAGTFFGDFLPALARSRARGALVWAFEPSAENHACARRTIAMNELHNVRLARAGLDVGSGVARLATADRDGVALGGASRVIRDASRARWFSNEEIELRSVDDAVDAERSVALIHLDVEGHEQSALSGALQTIARSRPTIVVETLPDAGWLAEHLEPLGYTLHGKVNINHVLSCGER
jgi:FkbM family methyltransferase